MKWIQYAEHWKSYHLLEYEEKSNKIIDSMANDFIMTYQTQIDIHKIAAKIIENSYLSKYILKPFYKTIMIWMNIIFISIVYTYFFYEKCIFIYYIWYHRVLLRK